jgi:hypothetical protein
MVCSLDRPLMATSETRKGKRIKRTQLRLWDGSWQKIISRQYSYYPAKTRRWGFGGLGPFSPSLASDCDWLRTGNDRSFIHGARCLASCNVCGWWAEGISQKLAVAGMAVGGQGNDGLRYCTGDSPRSLLRPVDPVNCFSSHASTVPCRFLSANFFFLVNSSTEFYLPRIPSPFLN